MEGKQKVALTFALHRDEVLVRRETVGSDIIKIGKDPKSHLRVDDELAARMHAVIEVASADAITVIDLGNEGGTTLNGARLSKGRLSIGDTLAVGRTRIVLERVESVALAASPRTTPVPGALFTGNPFTAPRGLGWDNPFAASALSPAVDDVSADAPEGSYTYAMVKTGPDVTSDECETSSAALEVMICWETTVLHVSHLTPPRSFYVGEEQSKHLSCDFLLPAEKLGSTRAPVVLADRGAVALVLIPGMTGFVAIAGRARRSVQALLADGSAAPCAELSGAHQVAFPTGSTAELTLGGMVFKIAAVNAGRAVATAAPLDTRTLPWTGVSALAHLGLLAAMAVFMPSMAMSSDGEISDEQRYDLRQTLAAMAEKEQEPTESEALTEEKADDRQGGTGQAAKGESGKMGAHNAAPADRKYGVAGQKNNEDPHLARAAALRDAADFGMIGLLASAGGGDPDAPTAPWGREDSSGNDAMSALGNMWGKEIGESGGAGGLGLTGVGEAGGGRGEGIGLGFIGTIGSGSGYGGGDGFGNGNGRLRPGGHKPKAPSVRIGSGTVGGRLPPEIIQRVVRQNFGRFRLCYENGLRGNPNLQGRVTVRFVIGRDGAVSSVGNGGSDLPDSAVVSCVVRAFYGLSFPSPDSGIVQVSYPIMFSPGG